MVVLTGIDVLPPKFPSPAYDAVSEWAPAVRVLMVKAATPTAFSEQFLNPCFRRETQFASSGFPREENCNRGPFTD